MSPEQLNLIHGLVEARAQAQRLLQGSAPRAQLEAKLDEAMDALLARCEAGTPPASPEDALRFLVARLTA